MNFTQIGNINSTHALNGKVQIRHTLKSKKEFAKLKFIFIEIRNQSYIPYYVENVIEASEDTAIVQLEDVHTVEEAKLLVGKNIYTEQETFNKLKVTIDKQLDFTGFQLYNQNNKLIGTISELIELPAQLLAVLFIDEKEVLIPIVESMILDINLNKNKLQLAIPEGLLDVYL